MVARGLLPAKAASAAWGLTAGLKNCSTGESAAMAAAGESAANAQIGQSAANCTTGS